MRKSGAVPLTLLAAAALVSIGCHEQPRHCVDAQNHLEPDSYCDSNTSTGFHYVYGGSSGGHYGDTVEGSSVSRGGFGHGGGGEGGGEGGE